MNCELFSELFFLERRHFVAHLKALCFIDFERRVGVFEPLSVSTRGSKFLSQFCNLCFAPIKFERQFSHSGITRSDIFCQARYLVLMARARAAGALLLRR